MASYVGNERANVTTPPDKSGGFSSDARPSRPRYRLNAQSERQDIAGRILIAVQGQATGAGMYTVSQGQANRRQSATAATGLRRVARIHGYHSHASIFRFVCQDSQEHRPARVMRAFGESCAGDTPHVQI